MSKVYPEVDGIPFDNHACRFGQPAAGFVIIMTGADDTGFNNTLFFTLEAAIKHAKSINQTWKPIVKSVRWEDTPLPLDGAIISVAINNQATYFRAVRSVTIGLERISTDTPTRKAEIKFTQAGITAVYSENNEATFTETTGYDTYMDEGLGEPHENKTQQAPTVSGETPGNPPT